MKLYKISDWAALFENNRSRTVKDLAWVPIPNRHDGENFSLIMRQEKGAEIYAAWILILQVASRCQPRGSLLRDNKKPHTPESLSIKTRAPENWFVLALDFLENQTDWLDIDTNWQDTAIQVRGDCQPPVEEGNGKNGKNGMEKKELERSNLDPPLVRLMTTLNTAYQRSPKQAWNYADEQAAVDALKREEWEPEIGLILSHRRKLSPDDRKFFAPSVFSCLSKFDEWLDKARAQKAAPIKATPPPPLKGSQQDDATLKRLGEQIAAHRKNL